MFEVTGFQLRQALRRWNLKREAATQAFPKTLYWFEGENKSSPDDAMTAIEKAENAIAALQTAQTQYNLAVKVEIPGVAMTLSEAVKRVGSLQRTEKLWRQAAGLGTPNPMHRYRESTEFDRPMAQVVEKDKTVREARAALSTDELTERISKANHIFGLLQAAIAEGNAKKVSLDVDPGLFE